MTEAKQKSRKIAFDIVVSPTSVLCDIYFRNPQGQAKTIKPKAGPQMLKLSALRMYVHVYVQWMISCACLYEMPEVLAVHS